VEKLIKKFSAVCEKMSRKPQARKGGGLTHTVDTSKLPVSEWRDDKPICTSQKLVLIDGVHITDGNNAFVVIFTEVESCLLQPLKVLRRPDLHAHLNTLTHAQF